MKINEILNYIKAGENETIEFKESIDPKIGKTITAFLNTKGGMVFIGVRDNGDIIGLTKKDIEKNIGDMVGAINPRPQVHIQRTKIGNDEIVIINVSKSEKIHTYGNIGYVRIGSTTRELELNEIIEKAGEFLLLRFDESPCISATKETLSKDLVQKYLETRSTARNIKIPDQNYEKVLSMLGAVNKGRITNAGVLFFSKNPQYFYPQANLRLVEFLDQDMHNTLNETTINGSVWEIIDNIYEKLKSIIKRESTTKEFKKVISPSFPIEALQEAVINALIHRNYFEQSDIRVFVFSDRIEIINPGSFPPDVSLDHPTHKPRNRLLSQYVYDLGYIEKYGSGITKMQDLCKKNGYPAPEFFLESRQTKVVFYFLPLKFRMIVKELDEKDKTIFDYLLKKKFAKTHEVVDLLKISKNSVVERLNKLIEKDLIKRSGRGKSIIYETL